MPRYDRLRASICAMALLLASGANLAHAQRGRGRAEAVQPEPVVAERSTEAEPAETAMRYFEMATEEYRRGQYPEAAAHLEQALVLDPEAPVLLFNLGRVYELMHRYDDALNCFERLIAVTPEGDVEGRARSEEALARLRGARERARLAEEARAAEQGPTPATVTVRQAGVADEAFWGTLITGGVIALGAVGLGVTSLVLHDDLGRTPLSSEFTFDQYTSNRDLVRTLGLVADISGAVGAATIATALLLFGLRDTEHQVPVIVGASADGVQLNFRGTF